ncbi:organic hydroperoxide resistance protein [Gracilibacillus caseinilyticus]|uniref:Organic hydroperoxide resistance protein n=1 Tax=Gracilibacillus caseinilyticus TaxID=2932256 RepID=A0ABY4F0T4_9BACI|nr:organic hydroperoxide resistance protein [Gracilibacillus caseinilyticus]UOQ49697.1 organic hydroperoxide resistance protein [Gracilibacillus caseinilyticus]
MGNALYTAKSTAEGGRQGKVTSSDGTLDLSLSMPKGLGGTEAEGTTNPEQLFSAGYAACFDSALQMVAMQQKKKITSKVTAEVSIGKDAGGFGLSAKLHAEIEGVSQEEASDLVEAAHKVCPYSRATNGNMDVEISAKAV